jgi:hypothetical protein
MSLLISGDLRLAKGWDLSGFDADAAAYIQRVEWADTIPLEAGTRTAINSFVVGCKADGIWSAIKASCILAGARTLSGALMPLAGTAPTNNGPFVSGDYNRKTGLVGDGSTKRLNSNRNNNTDPQNSKHIAIYSSSAISAATIGAVGVGTGSTWIARDATATYVRVNAGSSSSTVETAPTGFVGARRSSNSNTVRRANGVTSSVITTASATPDNANIFIFEVGNATSFSSTRLAFYSIGESLDLALLDARVTDLINAFAAAIP